MNRFSAPTLPAGGTADVTLLLEGTYPFVSGGVSSWVHQIVGGLPELKFAIVFVGSAPERYGALRYELPGNVVHLEEHYLASIPRSRPVVSRVGDAEFAARSAELHDAFGGAGTATLDKALEGVVGMLLADPSTREQDFLFGERSWEEICRRYERTAPDRSFLEYFWAVRSMHAPLFLMARAAAGVPRSRTFHVVSTGFAGFLGALLRRARNRPLVLTEHGIYTKERRIELLQATWIPDDDDDARGGPNPTIGYARQLWIRFFEVLGKMTYDAANPIVSLYAGNRERQVKDGADPARTRIVPNGIDLERFAALRSKRPASIPPVLGLIGRVVPIKDIKTFVRAMRIVVTRLPGAQGWIVGPDDEDERYAEECRHLARTLDLTDSVKFLGLRNVDEILPQLGLTVLTSISEAQPLVVLEGMAAGLPCVASDVGCCRELVEGRDDADRALGAAGEVVDIADPEATARACIGLLRDPERWAAAQRAGIARVERLYARTQMLDSYREIYAQALRSL